ncbi:hypothetical protein E2553_35865 [Paraburkholderia dipogonis]|uniref:Uncharacterized protein n=1 Tax=Paraburkholderia dipogonis TaxID=1211383 RepID=A0A4Y8MXB9_9BURK|nr:hypothetical protein E2553_35865 [Paraburkholderia dipogonis]
MGRLEATIYQTIIDRCRRQYVSFDRSRVVWRSLSVELWWGGRLGAGITIAVDLEEEHLEKTTTMGDGVIVNPEKVDVVAELLKLTRGVAAYELFGYQHDEMVNFA